MSDPNPDAAPDAGPNTRSRLMPKGRLEAFADGVFAIVITLIVLELEVPQRDEGDELLSALFHEWRSVVAYLISFVFVGGVWIAHSTATRLMGRADDYLMRLNLVVLFFVSFLPFTTSMMATHLGGPGENVAVAIYGLNLLIASLVLNAFIHYAARHREITSDDVADEELLEIERQRRLIIAMQAAATLMAFVLPNVAVLLYLVISIVFIVGPLLQAGRESYRRRKA
jgi:uncharacterized membrane protein